jgi:hypothetical protein
MVPPRDYIAELALRLIKRDPVSVILATAGRFVTHNCQPTAKLAGAAHAVLWIIET